MPVDYVAWVRRANSRWIVHHDLSAHAGAYLDHLSQTDPKRLEASCRRAYLLARDRPSDEDPKPWFYSGVFSLANPAEIRQFLASHWLLRTVLTGSSDDLAHNPAGRDVCEPTLRKIEAIRQAVARLGGRADHGQGLAEPSSD